MDRRSIETCRYRMTSSYLLEVADIEWRDDAPYSPLYGDIYWHRDGALNEKQFVFIDPLRQHIGQLASKHQITVAELGFGFGINCLLAADFWRGMPLDCQLNLVSIEKHPPSRADLERLLNGYDFPATRELLAQYPRPYQGQHVIWLAPNVRLLLILDDVEPALSNLDAHVDFWFLDGFAPSKNESMWQKTLFRKMFARSAPGAGVATYSAAGAVRRGLMHQGFDVDKRPGFGGKKEMLCARRPGHWQPRSHRADNTVIVGGGLAGLFCLEAMQRRGLSARLIDARQPGPSTIPQLAVLPQLAIRPEIKYRFSLAALQYMQTSAGFHRTGVTWHGRNDLEQSRLDQISALFPDNIIEQIGTGSVVLHDAGWLSYSALVTQLNPNIIEGTVIAVDSIEDGLSITLENETAISASNVIIATGGNRSLLDEQLQVRAIRGQVISVPTSNIVTVVNSQVTLFPTDNGRSIVSGTYANEDNLEVDSAETRQLVEGAEQLTDLEPGDVVPRTGIRAVSRDRLPVIGQIPDWDLLNGVNRVSAIDKFQPATLLCTAFGSRGATHARLCAEHVIASLLGEPGALDRKQQAMLSAARFAIRDRAV